MIGSVLFAPSKAAQNHPFRLWTRSDEGAQEVGVSRLGAFDLFCGLDTEAIDEIARAAREKTIPGGTPLIRQGQVGNEIFLLEEGSVGVFAEGSEVKRLIGVLIDPAVFGEMAVANRERIRTASVETITDSKLLVIPIPDLLAYLKRFDALRNNLRRIIAERTPK